MLDNYKTLFYIFKQLLFTNSYIASGHGTLKVDVKYVRFPGSNKTVGRRNWFMLKF